MVKIFRAKDRIPVKIGELTVFISPLSFEQKTELQAIMMSAAKEPMNAVRGARLAIKYAVKSVTGLENFEGEPYVCELAEDGTLSDECVDDLLNMQEQPKLIALCSQLISGIPKQVMDPTTRQPMAGVSIEVPQSRKPKARQK